MKYIRRMGVTMKDYVYKMLKKSLKNDYLAESVLKRFTAFKILNNNRDFNWDYEQSKCNMVHEMVKARKEYNHKSILKAYKEQMKKAPYLWYDEFQSRAKHILKNYSRKD